MPLAVQVADPGSRGQDARYRFDPSYMTDLGGGFYTDGQFTYRGDPESMLAEDRPSVRTGSLPPADDTDSVLRYSRSVPMGAHGGGAPAKPTAAPVPQLQMGNMLNDRGSTPSDPMFRDLADWSAQGQAGHRQFLEGMWPDIMARNPGLYADQADYMGDINAFLGGNAQPLLDRNQKVVPRMAMPKFNAAVNPAKVADALKVYNQEWAAEKRGNPYGTLGPSPGRVAKVDAAAKANIYGTLGPSPQRVANVKKALVTPQSKKPISIPVRPAPTQPPKPILAKKAPPKRSGV
jgi:hypothetical protein